MGQWTGSCAQQLLDYAKDKGGDWHDIEIQLAFAMSEDRGHRIFKDMIAGKNPGADDPGDAAFYYLDECGRTQQIRPGVGANDVTRREQAGIWYVKMRSWSADSSLGSPALALAGQTQRTADNKGQGGTAELPGLQRRARRQRRRREQFSG